MKDYSEFPEWYFRKPTKKQLSVIVDMGFSVDLLPELNRGQVSDIIGCFHEPSDDELDALLLFDKVAQVKSQTEAREIIRYLMKDESN